MYTRGGRTQRNMNNTPNRPGDRTTVNFPGRPSGGPPFAAGGGGRGRGFGWWWLVGIILVLLIIPSLLTSLITDWMWFTSQNLEQVYTTRLWLGVGVFFGAGLLAAIFCWANWGVAARLTRPDATFPGQRQPVSRRLLGGI